VTGTSASSLSIATPAHAAVLASIHAGTFPPGQNWDETAFARLLSLPGVRGIVDHRGGIVLVRLAADEAEVLTLAVIPAMQRQGIARRLLHAAIRDLRAMGARVLFLEVSSSNTAARALYTAAGFHQVGRRKRYYADGTDALVLELVLSPGRVATEER
jgi:ribosomal-protein-alanine N-acetyltransferase